MRIEMKNENKEDGALETWQHSPKLMPSSRWSWPHTRTLLAGGWHECEYNNQHTVNSIGSGEPWLLGYPEWDTSPLHLGF